MYTSGRQIRQARRVLAKVLVLAALGLEAALLLGDPRLLLDAPFEPAEFHGPAAMPLLLARLLLLVSAFGRTGREALGVGLLFLLGLVIQGAFPIFSLAAAAVSFASPPAGRPWLPAALLAAAAVAMVAPRAAPAEAPSALPEQVVYFAERGNRYRARDAARAWCAGEAEPAAGCLVLAQADLELGDRDQALRSARLVSERAPDEEVRRAAARWLSEVESRP